MSHREMRDLMDRVTGTRNRETVAIGTPAGGAIAMALQSAEDDVLLDSILATLSASASRQFSRSRAGLFVAGLDGLTGDQLLDIAGQDRDPDAAPTGLAVHVSRFLESTSRDHVVGVALLSAGALRPSVQDVVDSGGTAYYFPKKSLPLWSDDFSGLFGRNTTEIAT
jgi:hypothetical protein